MTERTQDILAGIVIVVVTLSWLAFLTFAGFEFACYLNKP